VEDDHLRLVRAGPDFQGVVGGVTIAASVWGGMIQLADDSRDWQVGGGVGAIYRIGRNVDLAATFDVTAAPWAEDVMARNYARRHFGLHLIAHATGRSSLRKRPPDSLRPVVSNGRVRFRFKSAQASAISVVGSWDDWNSPGITLNQTREPGLWEAEVEVPPGAHRYRILVDGRPVRPPDAPRYVKDDFDGEDAVIDVPRPRGTP
jgi:hypothetical protein